jgi:GNAT superfamily N-acetyltransferase
MQRLNCPSMPSLFGRLIKIVGGEMINDSVVKFKYELASAELAIMDDKTARLRSVYSVVRRMGHATELMIQITEYADEHGLCVYLVPQRYGRAGRGALNNDQLIDFYKKFGFMVVPDKKHFTMMYRKPSQKKQGL